jgi:hypothetical protein
MSLTPSLFSLIACLQLTLYNLMALFSCVYAFRKLTRPGMSSEVKRLYILKHISYVGTFILIWTFYLAYSYFKLFNAGVNIDEDS